MTVDDVLAGRAEWAVVEGDCLDVLVTLPDGAVQCCVTSPPYWGLRDYKTGRWEGGDAECDHVEMSVGMSDKNTLGPDGHRETCGKCGAVRVDDQIGLESTPEEYVSKLVSVFREVKRVLRDDGTLWLNLGDSYCAAPRGSAAVETSTLTNPTRQQQISGSPIDKRGGERKPKDLVGIPWMVAFALRADGWWLRSDIIWHKTAPMPESVRDRPTRSHEFVFLLTKSERYAYDADAVRSPHSLGSLSRYEYGHKSVAAGDGFVSGNADNPRGLANCKKMADNVNPLGANLRDVWTLGPEPFAEAHFAVMPTKLVEPCIKAGCPPDGVVLDPFAGAGTVGVVARRLGRAFIGVELSPQYAAMARRRIASEWREEPRAAAGFTGPLFGDTAP